MKLQKIPQQRINGKLKPLNLAKVDSIVLHHMAHATADVKTVERWHVQDNGWNAIGYNYWIAFDGTVYEGRGLHVGAGVANHNSHIISIGFQGDYDKNDIMPDAQFNAAIDLINYLLPFLPNCKAIKGHRDFGGTVCPGTYFPLEEMKKLRYRSEKKMLETGNDIVWELMNGKHKIEIKDVDKAVKALDKAKDNEDFESLYWILHKLVNVNE